jgi:hypothetical protein
MRKYPSDLLTNTHRQPCLYIHNRATHQTVYHRDPQTEAMESRYCLELEFAAL